MSEEDHKAPAEVLHQSPAMIVLSGYACPLYEELYEKHGWVRRDKRVIANFGAVRTESVWLNSRVVAQLEQQLL